ncbi:hypothetical protein MUK42_15861 [Musa troglodytarum]|uniref:Uncharacterized protein n=1 Tax=Musa troglodytarum TaxID=320322 RepID=A0A9E7HGC1_9LILI|nr:hypothetical protein MUK42_15861 [Musa troglodytarum]
MLDQEGQGAPPHGVLLAVVVGVVVAAPFLVGGGGEAITGAISDSLPLNESQFGGYTEDIPRHSGIAKFIQGSRCPMVTPSPTMSVPSPLKKVAIGGHTITNYLHCDSKT